MTTAQQRCPPANRYLKTTGQRANCDPGLVTLVRREIAQYIRVTSIACKLGDLLVAALATGTILLGQMVYGEREVIGQYPTQRITQRDLDKGEVAQSAPPPDNYVAGLTWPPRVPHSCHMSDPLPPTPLEQAALDREAVLRRLSDAEHHMQTERWLAACAEVNWGAAPTPAHRANRTFSVCADSAFQHFEAELMAASHLPEHPYPHTARRIAALLHRYKRVPTRLAVLRAAAWPLAMISAKLIPAAALPFWILYQQERKGSFGRENRDEPAEAIAQATSHDQRIAAKQSLHLMSTVDQGRFWEVCSRAHLNVLLAPAGLAIGWSDDERMASAPLRNGGWINTPNPIPGCRIWESFSNVRARANPEAGAHGFIAEPQHRAYGRLHEGLKDAGMVAGYLASRMRAAYGTAALPPGYSLRPGRRGIFLIARVEEIERLPTLWQRGPVCVP